MRRLFAGPFPPAACLGVLLAAAAAPRPAPAPASPPAPPAPATASAPARKSVASDGVAVHVFIETFAIDRKGTWSAGSDEADLFPGTPGVLEKSIILVGRDRNRTQDRVVVKARFTPDADAAPDAACALRAEFETRRDPGTAASGAKQAKPAAEPLDRRETLVTIAAGEERLVDVYASVLVEGRVAMRVRCAPSRPEAQAVPDMVTLDVSVEKDAEGEPPEILRSQRLLATLGHEAGTVVTANVTLPDTEDGSKRYRRMEIDATLTPLIIVAGKLQIDVHLKGEIATVRADAATVSYAIDRSETFVVAPSEPRSFAVDVVARDPDEGWKKVTLTLGLIARF